MTRHLGSLSPARLDVLLNLRSRIRNSGFGYARTVSMSSGTAFFSFDITQGKSNHWR
jgi:hypothetical protein